MYDGARLAVREATQDFASITAEQYKQIALRVLSDEQRKLAFLHMAEAAWIRMEVQDCAYREPKDKFLSTYIEQARVLFAYSLQTRPFYTTEGGNTL